MTRFDEAGMFWQDYPVERSSIRRAVTRPLAPVPETGWTAPKELPDLRSEKIIGLDTETYDPGLEQGLGPGQRRGGYIAGISVAVASGQSWYLPIRHKLGGNLDEQNVLRWAKDNLTGNAVKVGANLLYDLDYFMNDGIEIPGPYFDVQIAEPLIDDTCPTYSLDRIARKYIGEGKYDEALYQWCSRSYGGLPVRKDQGKNIWRAPVELVGPYAEQDAVLPLRIMEKQAELLRRYALEEVFAVERRLLPILLAMRRHGVRIDQQYADQAEQIMTEKEEAAQRALNNYAGTRINVWASESIAKAYDAAGQSYPKTKKGNPSFTKDWLRYDNSELSQLVLAVRKWGKSKSTFLHGHIDRYLLNGRIHAEFNQLKGDEYGSIARFSSSRPNLQNIPKRDKEMMRLLRRLFLPDEGCRWRRYDWSQIEYRFLVHFARGISGEKARQAYCNNRKTDFHDMVQKMIAEITLKELEREPTKTINFGFVYGMGIKACAKQLGVSYDEAAALFKAYHTGVPFVKDLFDHASRLAEQRGFVRTILKRRALFNAWEPRRWEERKNASALPKEQAEQKWGRQNIIRASTHKALSRVLQGSAADLMKKAMADIWDAGLCDVTGPPLLTVHDELGFSDPQTNESEEAFDEIAHIMETCIPLRVPIIVEQEAGPNWAELQSLNTGDEP